MRYMDVAMQDAEASEVAERWCDGCLAKRPALGFHRGYCSACIRKQARLAGEDALLDVVQLALRRLGAAHASEARRLIGLE